MRVGLGEGVRGAMKGKYLELKVKVHLVYGPSKRSYFQEGDSCHLRVPCVLSSPAPPSLYYQNQTAPVPLWTTAGSPVFLPIFLRVPGEEILNNINNNKNNVLCLLGPYCVVTPSCLTLCDPMDPQGSSVHRILQARILEWVTISFSRGSSQTREQNFVWCIAGRFFEPPGMPLRSLLGLTIWICLLTLFEHKKRISYGWIEVYVTWIIHTAQQSPPCPRRNMFQDIRWMSETEHNTKPDIHYDIFFPYIYLHMINFNL